MTYKNSIGETNHSFFYEDGARKSSSGTGFLVGPNDLLTNAHVAFDDDGNFPDDFEVRFENGEVVDGLSAKTFDGAPFGDNIWRWDVWEDLAVVTLEESVGLRNGWFGLTKGVETPKLQIAGYPNTFEGEKNFDLLEDTVDVSYNYYFDTIDFQSDVGSEGASGSPLWEQRGDSFYVHGVLSSINGDDDHAALFTDETFAQIGSWIANNGTAPDIAVSDFQIEGNQWEAGDPISYSLTLHNDGDVGVGDLDGRGFWSSIYISKVKGLLADGHRLEQFYTSDLGAGSELSLEKSFTFDFDPDVIAPGKYWVGAIVDSSDMLIEPDENGNNWSNLFEISIGQSSEDGPDLVAQNVTISNAAPEAGDSITVSYEIANIGSGSANNTVAGVYLSTDSIIDGHDTLLGTRETFFADNPGDADSETKSVTLPSDLSPETYYIGVIADYGDSESESNETNNASGGIHVNIERDSPSPSGPDLKFVDFDLNGFNFNVGQRIYHSFKYENVGDEDALPFQGQAYITSERTLTGATTFYDFNDHENDGLAAGEWETRDNAWIQLGDGWESGYYYVAVELDSDDDLNESDEGNNVHYERFYLNGVDPEPDLVARNVSVSDTSPTAGDEIDVDYEVANIGSGSADNTVAGVYLSTDSVIGSDDTLLGTNTTLGADDPSDVDAESETVTLPAGLAPGTYYIGVIADDDDTESESDEDNNASSGISIDVQDVVTIPPSLDMKELTYDPATSLLSADFDVTDPRGRGVSINVEMFSEYDNEVRLDGQLLDYGGVSLSPSDLRAGVSLTGVQAGNRLDFDFQADDGFAKSDWDYGELQVPWLIAEQPSKVSIELISQTGAQSVFGVFLTPANGAVALDDMKFDLRSDPQTSVQIENVAGDVSGHIAINDELVVFWGDFFRSEMSGERFEEPLATFSIFRDSGLDVEEFDLGPVRLEGNFGEIRSDAGVLDDNYFLDYNAGYNFSEIILGQEQREHVSGTIEAEYAYGDFDEPDDGTLNGTYGQFAFDRNTGDWSYTLNEEHPELLSLSRGEEVTDSFTVTSSEHTYGEKIKSTETVTVSIREGTSLDGGGTPFELVGLSELSIDENNAVGTLLATASSSDYDNDQLRFTLNGVDAAAFAIEETSGEINLALSPDYEAPSDMDGDNTYELTVAAVDPYGTEASESFTVQVRDVNEVPAASGDVARTAPDRAVTITAAELTGNDADPDGDALVIASVSDGENGSAALNPDGTVTFMPGSGFAGAAGFFDYTISDGTGGEDTARVLIIDEHGPVQLPEVYLNGRRLGVDDFTIDLDQELLFLDVTLTQGMSYGAASSLLDAGQPLEGFWRASVDDVRALTTSMGFVPGRHTDTMSPIVESLGATDPGSIQETIGYVASNNPSADRQPTLRLMDYPDTPANTDQIRSQSFLEGGYDKAGHFLIRDLSANFPENAAPDALDDSANTFRDTAVTLAAAELTGNDAEPDGDPLSITSVQNPSNGTAVLNPDGTVTFTPDAGFDGAAGFDYTVEDGRGGEDTGRVDVTVEAKNRAPTASTIDAGNVSENGAAVTIDLLGDAGAADSDGGTLGVSNVSVTDQYGAAVAFGLTAAALTIAPTQFAAALAAGESATLAVAYDVTDGQGGVTSNTGQLVVDGLDGPFTWHLDGDGDGFGVDDPATNQSAYAAQAGTSDVAGDADDADDAIYPGAPEINDGKDNDQDGATDEDNTAPVADAEALDVAEDDTLTVAVAALLDGDTDVDGDKLTVTSVSDPVNGTVALDDKGDADAANDEVIFTPTPGYSGPAAFDYTIADGFGGEGAVTVTIDVAPVNDAPVIAATDTIETEENTTEVTTLTATDVDSENLTFSISGGEDADLFEINSTSGTLTFKAAPDFEAPVDQGEDNAYEVEIAVSDGDLVDDTFVFVNVQDVDDDDGPELVQGETDSQVTGSDDDEIIQPNAGTMKTAIGEGGADVFDFSDTVHNGAREFRTILDYTVGEDMIELGDGAVIYHSVSDNRVQLFADQDFDVITVVGANSLDEIQFI